MHQVVDIQTSVPFLDAVNLDVACELAPAPLGPEPGVSEEH